MGLSGHGRVAFFVWTGLSGHGRVAFFVGKRINVNDGRIKLIIVAFNYIEYNEFETYIKDKLRITKISTRWHQKIKLFPTATLAVWKQ